MKNLFRSLALVAVMFVGAQYASAQQKIGHINFGEIISSTNEFKVAQEQLKTLQQTKFKELEGMHAEFLKKQTEANDKLRSRSEANKDTIDAQLQTLGQELQAMDQRIQEVQRLAEEDLGKKEQELFEPIQKKVIEAIGFVSKEKGYAYVLDVSNGSIPYFAGGDDLTSQIKTKLGVK